MTQQYYLYSYDMSHRMWKYMICMAFTNDMMIVSFNFNYTEKKLWYCWHFFWAAVIIIIIYAWFLYNFEFWNFRFSQVCGIYKPILIGSWQFDCICVYMCLNVCCVKLIYNIRFLFLFFWDLIFEFKLDFGWINHFFHSFSDWSIFVITLCVCNTLFCFSTKLYFYGFWWQQKKKKI